MSFILGGLQTTFGFSFLNPVEEYIPFICDSGVSSDQECLQATLLGHVVSKGPGTTQEVGHMEEPLLAITQFY